MTLKCHLFSNKYSSNNTYILNTNYYYFIINNYCKLYLFSNNSNLIHLKFIIELYLFDTSTSIKLLLN